ncbi:chromosome condensation regulator RCC1, partial [Aureibaculum sp. A20]|nr:chromosome condensation regulator RCC1 [Aureibaculum flavum]
MKKFTITFLLLLVTYYGFTQTTYVPDDNFEQALIDLGYDSGPLDDYVPTANINTVLFLSVSSKNISDLTGIEDFVALEELLCFNNQLSNLDISNNLALKELKCYSNNLTNLNVKNNTALTLLHCYYNDITALDVSYNISLEDLRCGNSLLTALDVTNNINLQKLIVANAALTSLNLSNNNLLEWLRCNDNELASLNIKNDNNTIITQFYANNNPNLTCIKVDDVTYSTSNWTNIDTQTSFSVDCIPPQLTYVPDDNFEQALIDLGYDAGPLDDYVPTANINTITDLDIRNKNI